VLSLDCRFSDRDNTPSEVTQFGIENCAMLPSEHLSMEPTYSINQKRVKKLPRTRSDDFYGHGLSIFWVIKFNKPPILIHHNIRGLVSTTD
jgi:hypothetical protein